jgi:hypothetical protein
MTMNAVTTQEALELAEQPRAAALPAVQQQTPPATMPARQLSVVEYAVASGAPVSEVRALVELQIQMDNHKLAMRKQDDEREREMRAEAARNAYAEAMAKFKAAQVRVVRNKLITDGPLKGKKHADLFAVTDAATEHLSAHGLSVSWETLEDAKDWIRIACRVKHVAGHSEAVAFGGPVDKGPGRNEIQARKSTITYLERFTMLMALGLAEQDGDDDGNGGPRDHNQPPPPPPAPATYDQERFDNNLNEWKAAIRSGRTNADRLITFIESRGAPLTNEQKQTIKDVK